MGESGFGLHRGGKFRASGGEGAARHLFVTQSAIPIFSYFTDIPGPSMTPCWCIVSGSSRSTRPTATRWGRYGGGTAGEAGRGWLAGSLAPCAPSSPHAPSSSFLVDIPLKIIHTRSTNPRGPPLPAGTSRGWAGRRSARAAGQGVEALPFAVRLHWLL